MMKKNRIDEPYSHPERRFTKKNRNNWTAQNAAGYIFRAS